MCSSNILSLLFYNDIFGTDNILGQDKILL